MAAATAKAAEAEHQHVLHTLIQEAQQEIGRLRAELYSTSRLADERKWVPWTSQPVIQGPGASENIAAASLLAARARVCKRGAGTFVVDTVRHGSCGWQRAKKGMSDASP
jgi:hypothetical protein